MANFEAFFTREYHRLQAASLYLPHPNPTFGNPEFAAAEFRVLIVRLSPFRDVARSTPHLFLAQAARRAVPQTYVDMAFFPLQHDRERLEREAIPLLVGTQSFHTAEDFDVVLISNAYVLELINLPYLLLRSGIPLLASQRDEHWPPLLLGGSNALATQAILSPDGDSIADAVFFGEGEGQVETLLRRLYELRHVPKRQRLAQVQAEVVGLWIPGLTPTKPLEKAICRTPTREALLTAYPLLNDAEVGVGRLQINYGCPAFCSFCFEGYDRKPYREVPLADVLEAARQLKRQGCAEIDLYSFNFNTYSDILALLLELNRLFDRVSFKSQRVDLLYTTPGLLAAEIAADKRSFTLGIEGISERQRAFLHKSLSLEAIRGVLAALLQEKIREIKLFYILTGYETEADLAEFRGFVRELKTLRQRSNPGIRIIFSVGLLVRMPFTPLQYDRLFLEETDWRPIIGAVKSACETNGFEFRMPAPWDEVAVSQVLALGGTWLLEPLIALASEGHCYDLTLTPGYWDALRAWLGTHGLWTATWLGSKGPEATFPLEMTLSSVTREFLYRQYTQARAAVDEGYCLGQETGTGHCLDCGACGEADERRILLTHRLRTPPPSYWTTLPQLLRTKWRLKPLYVHLRVPPALSWTEPEWRNAWALRTILAAAPDLEDNLLAVRESLFSTRELRGRWGMPGGETIFALKAWEPTSLAARLRALALPGLLGVAERFMPGVFETARLHLTLPVEIFPQADVQLRDYLRAMHLPVNLRRTSEGVHFDLAPKALKKRIVLEAAGVSTEKAYTLTLHVSSRFDLLDFLRSFADPYAYRRAEVIVSELRW